MSNAALMIPGCKCCEKTGICDCSDIDPSKAVGMRVDVPDLMELPRPPTQDPTYADRSYWKTSRPDYYVEGYPGGHGQSPVVALGGDPACAYQIRFTINLRIDRGSYGELTYGYGPGFDWGACFGATEIMLNSRRWPYFGLLAWPGDNGLCAAYSRIIAKSTGEGMRLAMQDYHDGYGTAIVLDVPPTPAFPAAGIFGPCNIQLAWGYFRFSAGCYAEIIAAECIDAYGPII